MSSAGFQRCIQGGSLAPLRISQEPGRGAAKHTLASVPAGPASSADVAGSPSSRHREASGKGTSLPRTGPIWGGQWRRAMRGRPDQKGRRGDWTRLPFGLPAAPFLGRCRCPACPGWHPPSLAPICHCTQCEQRGTSSKVQTWLTGVRNLGWLPFPELSVHQP